MQNYLHSTRTVQKNENDGIYGNGEAYDIAKKLEVLTIYYEVANETIGRITSVQEVARRVKVSKTFVYKILAEFRLLGYLEDPTFAMERAALLMRRRTKIHPEASLFLLALRYENDLRPLITYREELLKEMGLNVSVSTIDCFFKTRFDFAGNLRKPNLVPLDKWKPANIEAYHRFMTIIAPLNHWKFHFLDEKHIVNKDCQGNRVRADPLTGAVRCIKVSGNFREAYNMIAIISANPVKPQPINYILGKENGTAAVFTAYIKQLIAYRWFEHGDILIMDNASIHTGAEASIVADLLWTVKLDVRPLHVLVVPLPTRSPELNPIELVFHIWRVGSDLIVINQTIRVRLRYQSKLKKSSTICLWRLC